ncbi:MAG: hypothetical protein Q9162_000203 [Coniocarpon cinnabarinum]
MTLLDENANMPSTDRHPKDSLGEVSVLLGQKFDKELKQVVDGLIIESKNVIGYRRILEDLARPDSGYSQQYIDTETQSMDESIIESKSILKELLKQQKKIFEEIDEPLAQLDAIRDTLSDEEKEGLDYWETYLREEIEDEGDD